MSNFAEIRMSKGISLEVAAQYIGVSVNTMQHLENNSYDMKISDAVMLADLYREQINRIRF